MRFFTPNRQAGLLFLILSATVHAALVHGAYRPAVAVQDTVAPLEVSLIRPAVSHSAQATGHGNEAASAEPSSSPVAARAMQHMEQEPASGMHSEAVVPGEVLMLPILQVQELLYDRLASAGFDASEYLQKPAADTRYYGATDVQRRVRARQNLLPVYPKEAYEANRQGRVMVELLIDAEGVVEEIRVIAATAGFDVSAREALRGMHFHPAERHGEKVASRMLIEMQYLLVKASSGQVDNESIMPIGSFAPANS